MITISNIQATITDTNPPYRYLFESDSACLSFTNAEGTTSSNTIKTDAIATSSNCITGTNATLTVINSKGCSQTLNLTLDDPCTLLVCGDTITQPAALEFKIWATSILCDNISFDWQVGPEFVIKSQQDSDNSSTITLTYNSEINLAPESSYVAVTITDCNGCQVTKGKTFNLCRPYVEDTRADMFCTDLDNNSYTGSVQLTSENNDCASPIDWTTLEYTIVNEDGIANSNLEVTTSGTKTGFLRLSGVNLTETPDNPYLLKYTVRDKTGVKSNTGTVYIQVYACDTDKQIYGSDKVVIIPSTASPGDDIVINLSDALTIKEGTTIDSTTFALVTPPTPLSGSITFVLDGYDTIPTILYDCPNPIAEDVFAFTVCNTDGYCCDAIYVTMVPEGSAGTAGITGNLTTLPNRPVTGNPFISSGTTGSKTTTSIVAQPTKGIASVLSDGSIKYTPYAGTQGSDSVSYNIKDVTGKVTGTATANFTIVYAGEDTTYNLCSGLTVTPYNILDANSPSTPDTTGSWRLVSTTGPAAPGTYNGTIDFSAYAGSEAMYCYEYEVTNTGVSHTAKVLFIMDPYTVITNETCATASAIPLTLTSGSTGVVNNIEMEQNCPGSVGATDSGVAEPASWNIVSASVDMWYKVSLPSSSTEYTFTISVDSSAYSDADALKYPKLALYSACTPTIIDSTNALNERRAVLTHTESSLPVSAKTFYIRVAAEDGEEGKFNINIETL